MTTYSGFWAGDRHGPADEGLLIVLVLDLVGEQQVELGLVARLHRRPLDDDTRDRADVLGKAPLGALQHFHRETAGGERGDRLREPAAAAARNRLRGRARDIRELLLEPAARFCLRDLLC